jgi:hypothetical protein
MDGLILQVVVNTRYTKQGNLFLILFNIVICVHFRHILACLHFNENVKRSTMTRKDGKKYLKVTYPKHKLGDEVVREVPVPPTYGKSVFAKCCTTV